MSQPQTLSVEQVYALEQFKQGENLFITGPGGTGKTFLIRHLLDHVITTKKVFPVCAMTGCAAVLLNCNARTLHSWSGIRLAKGKPTDIIQATLKNKTAVSAWKKADGLILDEVSMLSEKVFDIIEELGRVIRRNNTKPFGGLQVVFTGDFFQLPPVETESGEGRFCFQSKKWSQVFKPENHIELKTMFRQTDPAYIGMLQEIRHGTLSKENIEILKTYVKRETDLEKTNGCVPTKLFPLRSKVDYINNMMFSKIGEPEFVFETIKRTDCTQFLESTKAIPAATISLCLSLSQQEIGYELDQLQTAAPCQPILRLKKGAAVMCLVNLDMDNGICNGSQGIVIDIITNRAGTKETHIPIVRFSNGLVKRIDPYFWQSENYPMMAIGQIPLCLAWALTIHKIQGATLAMAEMDIGQSIFEYGQTYVALSRIQSLDGLYLSAFNPRNIKANPHVIAFYEQLQRPPIPTTKMLEEEPTPTKDQTTNTIKVIKL
jgi:ATP-dependent DNA helicase PIF1